jgi:hypothetical protein
VPGVPTSGFGAPPPPYASDPNAPTYNPLPTYVPPTWTGGDYQNPTVEDLYNSPGYQARLDERLKAGARRYAAQGTILNGGTLKALDRSAQDYATGEYQTLRNNTYDAYVQKYKQFTDAAGMDLNARTINANENQNTFANRVNTYTSNNARTLSDYLTNATTKRNAELDYWSRLQDVRIRRAPTWPVAADERRADSRAVGGKCRTGATGARRADRECDRGGESGAWDRFSRPRAPADYR